MKLTPRNADLPFTTLAKRVKRSSKTLRRWHYVGLLSEAFTAPRAYLDAICIGRDWYTSEEAFEAFIDATQGPLTVNGKASKQ